MIVLLDSVSPEILQPVCKCALPLRGYVGVVLVKEVPGSVLLYWSLRSYTFEPFKVEDRLLPYVKFGRAQNNLVKVGGQFALWLRSFFDWNQETFIVEFMGAHGRLAVSPTGDDLSIEQFIALRRRLGELGVEDLDQLWPLREDEGAVANERQLQIFHSLVDGEVTPAIKNIVLEMLPPW